MGRALDQEWPNTCAWNNVELTLILKNSAYRSCWRMPLNVTILSANEKATIKVPVLTEARIAMRVGVPLVLLDVWDVLQANFRIER